MLSKSLIQYSVDGWGCVLSLLFDLRPNYGGGKGKNGNLLPHSVPLTLQQAIHGHSRAGLGQSPVGSLLLSPGSWCTKGFVCTLQESVSSVLCKFWWLNGGVNGDLLQEGLCYTQVCCTQSPCSRPLLIHTSTEDTQTQFCLSLCGLGKCYSFQQVVLQQLNIHMPKEK